MLWHTLPTFQFPGGANDYECLSTGLIIRNTRGHSIGAMNDFVPTQHVTGDYIALYESLTTE